MGSVRSHVARALWVCLATGCLPAGDPPAGRQLMKGRSEDFVRFVDGAVGQPARILLSQLRPSEYPSVPSSLALSTVDDPGPGAETTPPRALLDRVSPADVGCSGQCGVPVDSVGRLYLRREIFTPATPRPGFLQRSELFRVDPETGAQVSLSGASNLQLQLSADRTRTAVTKEDDELPLHWIVSEPGGEETMVPSLGNERFVGNDFYFRTAEAELRRLRPGGESEVLTGDVGDFEVRDSARGPVVILGRAGNPSPSRALFDPVALVATALPPATASAQQLVLSPSGRYIFSVGAANPASRPPLTLFDRDTGEELQDVLPGPLSRLEPIWRPGHDELWLLTANEVWGWKPGEPLMKLVDGAVTTIFSDGSLFTGDGSFWYSLQPGVGDKAQISLRSADDPEYEPLLLNPQGTGLANVQSLADGRLLVEAWISDPKRNDIYLVDPVARTSRAVASTGNVVAVGRERVLALLHWVTGGSGELTMVDLATGAHTRLAENVYSVAVDGSASGDLLAPGTRVAYLVRNRIASPFDGLWVTTLP